MFPADTRFLLVDDAEDLRDVLKLLLQRLGYSEFVEASNGKEAQTAVGGDKPCQVVISDLNMPGISGIELLKSLRSQTRYKDLPFLLVSGEGDRKIIVEALQAGANNFLEKPFSLDDIKEKLTSVWDQMKK